MGLSNEITQEDHYGTSLSIVGGKFTLRVPEGTPKAETRELTKGKNEGKEVWELKYSSLLGFLMNGEIKTGQYPSVDITMKDFKTDEVFDISFPIDSGYLMDFMHTLPALDTSKEISIELVKKDKYTNLNVVQEGKKVWSYFMEFRQVEGQEKNQKIMLHDCPDGKRSIDGKWKVDDQREFLLVELKRFFDNYTPPTGDPAFAAEPKNEAVAAVEEALSQPSDVPLVNVAEPPEGFDEDIPF